MSENHVSSYNSPTIVSIREMRVRSEWSLVRERFNSRVNQSPKLSNFKFGTLYVSVSGGCACMIHERSFFPFFITFGHFLRPVQQIPIFAGKYPRLIYKITHSHTTKTWWICLLFIQQQTNLSNRPVKKISVPLPARTTAAVRVCSSFTISRDATPSKLVANGSTTLSPNAVPANPKLTTVTVLKATVPPPTAHP